MIVKAEASNRILDLGGWTDTWFAKEGAVLNFAVDLFARVCIKTRRTPGITITAYDFGDILEIPHGEEITYNGQHDLLKAALKVMKINFGLDVEVYSDVPFACGTGSSAAVSVALLAALDKVKRGHQLPHEIAQLAHSLETEQLKIQSGVQDQYAAAYGGINLIEISPYPHTNVSPLRLSDEVRWELESRLVVVYAGERHISSQVHDKVISSLKDGKSKTAKALEILKKTPYWGRDALLEADFERFAEVMNTNNDAQKNLHQEIVTPKIEQIEKIAKKSGGIGFKINGAGGGGSVTIFCQTDRKKEVVESLEKNGFKTLPCRFNFDGLRAWVAEF
jgi:D-glycero-alpha-D-manno-heptose-7-phosphate kinase